jgi:hypothetical protein
MGVRRGAQGAFALGLAVVTLGLTSCHSAQYYYYKFPEYTYAGRPIPPSKLAERVMISVTLNGSTGALQIVDALRDIRSNVENTIPTFSINGYGSGYPISIFNFPAETTGYVYSTTDGSLTKINYSTETSAGSVGTFQSGNGALSVPQAFTHYYGAEESLGILEVVDNQAAAAGTYALNLPNVYQVFSNAGDTVALAAVRNSNTLYRVFKLNQNQYPTQPAAIAATGSVDCQPQINPVYCVAPVPGTYDRPAGAYFSLDGTKVYILNCGPECGGTTASVTVLQQGPLNNNVIPKAGVVGDNPFVANIPVPGGVTTALSDGSTLYLAGQSLYSLQSDGTLNSTPRADGLFTGYLTTINLSNYSVSKPISISDGTHTKLLFADNNTLWVGSQQCGTGERAKQGMNYNCLTMVTLGGSTLKAQVVPNVTPGGSTTVPYPNENNNLYYYGNLTGLCWVQNFNKIYTAYGGQVHVFSTVDGSEINNQYVTVQGTALDVAYMDALTDGAD